MVGGPDRRNLKEDRQTDTKKDRQTDRQTDRPRVFDTIALFPLVFRTFLELL